MKTASQEVRLIAIRAYRSGISRQQTADIVGYHLNSVRRWIREFEQDGRMEARPRGHRISVFTDEERAAQFCGKVEVDESYFGGVRKGKRGRGAAGKTIVFGLLKRGGKVYTIPVADVKRDTLLPVIKKKIRPGNFELFLKECEWRFNSGTPKQLLKDLKMILKQKY